MSYVEFSICKGFFYIKAINQSKFHEVSCRDSVFVCVCVAGRGCGYYYKTTLKFT